MKGIEDKSIFELDIYDLKLLMDNFESIGSLEESKYFIDNLKNIVLTYDPNYVMTKENYLKRRDNLDLLSFDSTFMNVSSLSIASPLKVLKYRPDLDSRGVLKILGLDKMAKEDFAYAVKSMEFDVREKAKQTLVNYLDGTLKYTHPDFGLMITL